MRIILPFHIKWHTYSTLQDLCTPLTLCVYHGHKSGVLYQNGYIWHEQLITSHRYCMMWLLVLAQDTCFWWWSIFSTWFVIRLPRRRWNKPGQYGLTHHVSPFQNDPMTITRRRATKLWSYFTRYIVNACEIKVSWSVCDELGVTGVSYWPYISVASQ